MHKSNNIRQIGQTSKINALKKEKTHTREKLTENR